MMNRIMTTGVAVVALAASALLASPVEAQRQANICPITGQVLDGGPRSYNKGYGYSAGKAYGYGYDTDYGFRQGQRVLRRDAARKCRRAISNAVYSRGFLDLEFDDRRIRQIGPKGFLVRFETEVEGYRREFENDVYCTVRHGRVVNIEGVPVPGGRRGYGKGRYHRGW